MTYLEQVLVGAINLSPTTQIRIMRIKFLQILFKLTYNVVSVGRRIRASTTQQALRSQVRQATHRRGVWLNLRAMTKLSRLILPAPVQSPDYRDRLTDRWLRASVKYQLMAVAFIREQNYTDLSKLVP